MQKMRNTRKELNDIRFEFQPSKDSADGIANELLTAGLIVGDDLLSMAANLDRLITQPPSSKQLCFRISSGIATHETPDEKALLGFAQLSIVD
jgi:serine/threonine-protein kinase OSR1/STK39